MDREHAGDEAEGSAEAGAPQPSADADPESGVSGGTERRHWYLLGAAFVFSIGSSAYSIAPASIAPRLVEQYGVSNGAIGLAVSAFLLTGLIVQIPSGFLIDRRDTRVLATLAVALFASATVGGSLLPGYPALVGSRLVAGLAVPFLFIMLADVVGSAFPTDTQGFATSVFTAAAPTGFALGQFATPAIADAVGVQRAFLVYPAISIVGLGFFLEVAPSSVGPEETLDFGELRSALFDRSLVLLALSAMCFYGVYFFLNAWIPTYANGELSIPLSSAGALAALVPITGIVARPAGGWVSDRIGGLRRPIIVLASTCSLPLFLGILLVSSRLSFAALLLGVGFTLQFAMGVYYIFAKEVSPVGATGTGLAFFGTLSFVGNVVAPVTGGVLVDTVGWTASFMIYGGVGVVGLGFAILVDEPG
jgi:nitrate/nitrite transporter NarK